MLPTRRRTSLANGGIMRLHQEAEFERIQSHSAQLQDSDDLFGGLGVDDGYDEPVDDEEVFNEIPEAPVVGVAVPRASGIPFWPLEDAGPHMGKPTVFGPTQRVDVDMLVFRRVFACDLGDMFGEFALLEMGPTFGLHRGVTEGIANESHGAGITCKLYIGRCCGWQVFVENLSRDNRAALKAALIDNFNLPVNGAGYIKASSKPHVVAEKNVRVSLFIWHQVITAMQPNARTPNLEVTICVYGTKMPLIAATALAQKFNAHRIGKIDADFAFECACPAGFPIFRSIFFKKGGNNSGTTRIWHRLGRGHVVVSQNAVLEEDFGTVRYCIPHSPHQITFYCKAVQAIKVESSFDGSRMPNAGKTARDRINAIRVAAYRLRPLLVANPGRWQVARVEVTVKGAATFNDALNTATKIMREHIPKINCHIVAADDLLQQLEEVANCEDYVGTNAAAISLEGKENIAVLSNKYGLWYAAFAKFLPDWSREGVGQLVGPVDTRNGFMQPLEQPDIEIDDEDALVDDYIYEFLARANAKVKHGTRFTYMAKNDNNNRVSKKSLFGTWLQAKMALMREALNRRQDWRTYGVPRVGTRAREILSGDGFVAPASIGRKRAAPKPKDSDIRVGKAPDIHSVLRIVRESVDVHGGVTYLIKWVEHPEDIHDSWEPRRNVSRDCITEWELWRDDPENPDHPDYINS